MGPGGIAARVVEALRYGGLALALLGGVVVLWGLIDDRDVLVVSGLLSVAFGLVLPRLEHAFEREYSAPDWSSGAVRRAIRTEVETLQLPLDEVDRRDLEEKLVRETVSDLEIRAALIRAPAEDHRSAGLPPTVEIAAAAVAKDAVAHALNAYCENGHPLDEPPDLPAYQRPACPMCGSRSRRFELKLGARVPASAPADSAPTETLPPE